MKDDAVNKVDNLCRCQWAQRNKWEQQYHDEVWGKPIYDDKQLFKMLILEGMQAGLSWATILKKWDSLCEAFDDFNPYKVAFYDEIKELELLSNPEIIRNKLKIKAAINNSRLFLEQFGGEGQFSKYIWDFVNGKPILNQWERWEEIPPNTTLSDDISKDLKKRGFKFVGSTIIYSFMQAVGLVNDHISNCDFK